MQTPTSQQEATRLCISCRHHSAPFTGLNLCTNSRLGFSPVNGIQHLAACEDLRKDGKDCGPQGLWHEPGCQVSAADSPLRTSTVHTVQPRSWLSSLAHSIGAALGRFLHRASPTPQHTHPHAGCESCEDCSQPSAGRDAPMSTQASPQQSTGQVPPKQRPASKASVEPLERSDPVASQALLAPQWPATRPDEPTASKGRGDCLRDDAQCRQA